MIIKQLSVFLENRPGTLVEALGILKEGGVNIVALSLADTNEFGLMRVIVDKPEEAKAAMKARGFTSILNDVLMVHLLDQVGYLEKLVDTVSKAGINVEYMYAAPARKEGADLVMKTSDLEGAAKVIGEAFPEAVDWLD